MVLYVMLPFCGFKLCGNSSVINIIITGQSLKTSGFITLTFDLCKLIKEDSYRLIVSGISVFRDFKANDFEDAKLQANELIYDALRWNN